MTAMKDYLKAVSERLATGQATEHTYRPAFQHLLESMTPGVRAVNEPKRVECGAPDYVVHRNGHIVGYVEAKDVGKSLDEAQKSDQLKRYLASLESLILTDYVEFRWFVHGQERGRARIGRVEGAKLGFDADGAEEVRTLLLSYLDRAPQRIDSPEELARRMARITHMIRDIIIQALEKKKATYTLLPLRNAFARTLLPELRLEAKTPEFADMYAQTLAYGLFAARCNHGTARGPFQRLGAASEIPKTNPFLRELFDSITGVNLDDEPFAGFVEDLVQLLALADMEKILARFGQRSGRSDPVVHFYETFLAEYDAKLREVRGVYYTPEEVVSFIVRSVDVVLKRDFGLPDGLADVSKQVTAHKGDEETQVSKVLILDPACGTGTFLYAVVDHIRELFRSRGQAGMWGSYVRNHLLPRLFGFELLMAPYAVAHFKLGMQLAALDLPEPERDLWAYDFGSEERLHIYLTNTLEKLARRFQMDLPGIQMTISREGEGAMGVKEHLPIMVILGNPPYSGHSANASWKKVGRRKQLTFIGELIEDYKKVDGKPLGEKNPKWLQDDYVKFIRWAQWRIEQTGAGVVGFITNHGYLDNPTFRGMRQSLMDTFTNIYILDLHGSVRKKERAPNGGPDVNVFDIEQGVAIVILVKLPGNVDSSKVYHYELWGSRLSKSEDLKRNDFFSTSFEEIHPVSPNYFFVKRNQVLEKE